MRLDLSRSELPAPGLCRIVGQPARSCDRIELGAPYGSDILFRPTDGTRRIVVCRMSVSERGVIVGVDVFDIDTRRHLDVVQAYGEDPPIGGCLGALIGKG